MLLPGPSGWRQSAPACQRHQFNKLFSGTGPGGGVNTGAPGFSISGAAPGYWAGSADRSAAVMYTVAFTNAAKCSFLTVVRSIQNPSTYTFWDVRASGNIRSSLPIQNSPPG